MNIARYDAPRFLFSTTRSGSSGCAARFSHQANATRSTPPASRKPQVSGEPQGCDSALEKPYTMQKSPAETRTVPGTSSLRRSAGAPAASSRMPPRKATRANSRFTYRHQRQFRYWVRIPPSSSPTAPPVPAIAP